jgi:glycerol-3-phosphate dehydrogenase (NAD(P)+)
MRLAILGAGAWGTALAVHAARRGAVALWARDAAQVDALAATRRNRRYLPEVSLPDGVVPVADLEPVVDAVLHGGGLLVVATPMAGLEPMLACIGDRHAAAVGRGLEVAAPRVAWLCKGFQAGTGLLGHEIAERVLPQGRHAVLSGPTFAVELGRGQPTAMVCASRDAALAAEAVALLHHGPLRVYTADDPVGVEVGGAVKNVMAIATGIADGLPGWGGPSPLAGGAGLGQNARAALVTRGLAEMTRLGVRMGARPETFMGLSGLGDLVLTATGDLSRNRRVGLRLAAGLPLGRILDELGHVAEGVRCAPMVLARARALGVPMPITEAVVDVLDGRCTPAEAVERLLARDARPEAA